ncbi:MAG: HAMP domain-containing protein [Lachnospiraceae bacterium]|nr:HAMP domain-containing protein [Lachnospiraceae bacterium]
MRKGLSFRIKMLLAFAALIILCIVGTWILFRMLLDRFAIKRKVEDLEACYESLNELFRDKDSFNENDKLRIEVSTGQYYMIFLYNTQTRVTYTNYNSQGEPWYLRAMLLYGSHRDSSRGEYEVLKEHETYTIYQTTILEQDRFIDGSEDFDQTASLCLDAYGRLENGFVFLVRASYKQMLVDNRAVTDMLLLIGCVVLGIAVVVAIFFSRSVTKPIAQMSELSERMAKMDFEARCEVNSKDEIGVLADSLNRLSAKLQDTVGALKNANSELQRDLEHRTEIDEMRSEFIANVSHELKTPIALIQGYAEGLSENINEDPESRRFYCDVISDESAKMNRMVQKLMTLNQLEFGGEKIEYSRFDITGVLTGILNSTEVLRTQKEIRLHYHETEPVFVWADEYMIEEVITNYISNAMNHAGRSKEIAVSMQKMEKLVRVSVYNTGEPIPEEELDRIWIKFHKVDKARSREYGGSGIGLSIVKAIMDRHHQKYGAVNHENGVEFWFELELAEESVEN